MKPASAKPDPGHHRCLYLSATGRKCRSWVLDSRAMFCPRHMQAQPNGPDDFSLQLLHRACNFQNAEGIHDSLRHPYTLLASDAISPRRADVLGYLTSLLLRTLPAVYNDPLPLAGTLMSASQLAERDKAKSLPANASKPPAAVVTQKPTTTQKTLPAQQAAPTQKPALTYNPLPTPGRALTNKIVAQPSAQPTPQPPVHSTPSANAAPTGDYLDCGPGRPLPAIRAEFAAQILKAVGVTPRTPIATPPIPPKSNPADINPNAISPTAIDPAHINATGVNQSHTQVKSPIIPPAAKTTTEPTIQTTNEPVNQPTEKKRYQVGVHTNMHVTGSEPQWGWTTDP